MRRLIELLIAAGIGAVGTHYLGKKPRRRHRRHEQFLAQTSGSTMGISHDLLSVVHFLLTNALSDRQQPVWRTAENHSTRFAPTIVITVTTGLDAWLSELIAFARPWLGVTAEQVEAVINIGTVPDKYERTSELLLGKQLRASTALRQLAKLRNEIVHFLPYAQDITGQTVPDWLQYLEQYDLLITTNRDVDFHFSQKLCSYALAYWACETAHEAAAQFASKAQSNQNLHFVQAGNFRVTAGIHAPEELKAYDAQHRLTLTP